MLQWCEDKEIAACVYKISACVLCVCCDVIINISLSLSVEIYCIVKNPLFNNELNENELMLSLSLCMYILYT